MKEEDKIIEKAVKALKNEKVPSGPSQELTNVTFEKLNRIFEQPDMIEFEKQVHISEGINIIKSLAKFAVAAVLLIIAGFAAGRLTTSRPPDMEQIRASLEPAIREQLLGEMKQYMQLGMANSYVRLKDDLTEQYRRDLSQLAANVVNASGTVTNQLLQDLIETIGEAQAKERQWFAATLEQIELNRRQDKAQLGNALASFAVRTEDQLQQTRQDVEQLWSYTQSDSLVPNEYENSNNIN
jgi:hypothetical protein